MCNDSNLSSLASVQKRNDYGNLAAVEALPFEMRETIGIPLDEDHQKEWFGSLRMKKIINQRMRSSCCEWTASMYPNSPYPSLAIRLSSHVHYNLISTQKPHISAHILGHFVDLMWSTSELTLEESIPAFFFKNRSILDVLLHAAAKCPEVLKSGSWKMHE